MSPKYLIDVNLPYYFSIWNNPDYVHQLDIERTAKDSNIWSYAKSAEMTIITKDSDFSNRIIVSAPPPRIIHFRTGNISMKAFHMLISKIWNEVIQLSHTYKLVVIFNDKIEAFN
jgi:predicted nuclease of predicted toxin-antitoxin system